MSANTTTPRGRLPGCTSDGDGNWLCYAFPHRHRKYSVCPDCEHPFDQHGRCKCPEPKP